MIAGEDKAYSTRSNAHSTGRRSRSKKGRELLFSRVVACMVDPAMI